MRQLVVCLLLSLFACQSAPAPQGMTYTTNIDSTRFYYERGWEQIMDEGHYGLAELSYRKALEFDTNFLLGQAVLARLTLDLEERLRLFESLEAQKEAIKGDERKVLNVYIALTEFTNIRAQQPDQAPAALERTLQLAEKNLRSVVYNNPNAIYLKAEYIEILHSLQGPEAALDSLAVLTTSAQRDNPFLRGFAASLEAERGNFSQAIEHAQRLAQLQGDRLLPKSYAVFADVYFQMDSLTLAKQYADRAVELDPRNLDASRLQTRINAALKSVN